MITETVFAWLGLCLEPLCNYIHLYIHIVNPVIVSAGLFFLHLKQGSRFFYSSHTQLYRI